MTTYTATITKARDAQMGGPYIPTEIDTVKKIADFLLTGIIGRGKNHEITWRDGPVEYVTEKRFDQLCKLHPNWMTDF